MSSGLKTNRPANEAAAVRFLDWANNCSSVMDVVAARLLREIDQAEVWVERARRLALPKCSCFLTGVVAPACQSCG